MPTTETELETVPCHGCGDEHPEDDLVNTVDSHYLFCEDCTGTCDLCGDRYRYITDHYIHNCNSCGDRFCGDEYHYCDDCENYRCEDCGSCDCNEYSGDVHCWDYRPRPYKPKGEYPNQVLLGMELEVGGGHGDVVPAVQDVDCCEDHLYMKEDGSIDGVEIVTHPMTLEWAKGYPFDLMLRGLRNNGCYTGSEYGLHVHVSRNAFRRVGKRSARHEMAWLMFLYRNTDNLEKLARRVSTQWASFKKPEKGELKRKAERPDDDSERYVAVNCRNSKTYELRFFKSTLNDEEMWAALELADATVEYARSLKTPDILRGSALLWDRFIEWAEGQGRYPNLVSESTRLITEAPKPKKRVPRKRLSDPIIWDPWEPESPH